MKRLVLALLTALAVTLTSPALAADKLTVLLDWFVNPDHAPLVIAKEAGYFEEQGLDVTLVPPADPSAPPRLVAAGKGDIAISYQPNLYQQVAEGLPLVRFGTLVETPLNTVVALADGPVTKITDLKGKKVGFSVAGFEDAILGAMLGEVGLSLDDVELVNVNFALSPALLAGRVDAVVGAFRNFEMTQLELEGSKGRAFYLEEHGVPVYDELIFLAHRDHLDDARLRRFLAAVEKATIYLTNHPEEAQQMFLKAHPDLDNELNRRAFMDTLPRFAKRPAALDSARYKRFADFMKKSGLIEEARPVDDYAVELE
ncbi:putative hydroxymethylpyrimidine transport system substrate-binding protein [Rhodobium orientis]|uniref:ABC transporter ATP-binding protein n=1 Tax=Rhodobium orientis TaxID=34017 RepID=A0A327JT01_9HYPH|nr:ABC transporter substrate-binding protein [Rhodobium orientis]MBB4303038.1 putative hydroxymethylpyrimidine transport system substrate-binding protein [Rhodobium orientis]MBK5949596.1 ABC transporter ATP-binding protein [Rhodobium orientis]RAI29407.1 ABC transporter ATP-binding protein [Rhodobium orientis]